MLLHRLLHGLQLREVLAHVGVQHHLYHQVAELTKVGLLHVAEDVAVVLLDRPEKKKRFFFLETSAQFCYENWLLTTCLPQKYWGANCASWKLLLEGEPDVARMMVVNASNYAKKFVARCLSRCDQMSPRKPLVLSSRLEPSFLQFLTAFFLAKRASLSLASSPHSFLSSRLKLSKSVDGLQNATAPSPSSNLFNISERGTERHQKTFFFLSPST